MANQITHVALLERTGARISQSPAVLIGTLFPDIRYLGGITRGETHVPQPTWQKVTSASTEFEAGRAFHCLVDEIREQFMQEQGVYSLCPKSQYVSQALKCFEDERYYSRVSDWNSIISQYKNSIPEELTYPVPNEHVVRWHGILCRYMSEPPSDRSRESFILSIGRDDSVVKEINTTVAFMRNKPEITTILDEFWSAFPQRISLH